MTECRDAMLASLAKRRRTEDRGWFPLPLGGGVRGGGSREVEGEGAVLEDPQMVEQYLGADPDENHSS